MVVGARFRIAQQALLSALVLGGCAYQPDSFSYVRQPFSGVFLSISCLDIAIDHRRMDTSESNLVEYSFGNRCDQPVVVDLAAARVYGQTPAGSQFQLMAFDPFHELRSMRIDGRATGRETIDYPSADALTHLCIDAASIAHTSPARWVCFND